ncbi:O-antigen ligase family protein, partial [Acetoanaerobium noterae]|uniref:O-antigen ligase family protein n=1 Tax=Acetoanaerobium noterae TaxID=745369 RepID=UPI0032217182
MTNKLQIQNHRAKIWLVIFFTISLNIIWNAGFDNDISIYAAIILSVILILDIYYDEKVVNINNIALVLFVFLFWSSFSIIWSVYPIRTVIESVQLSVYLLAYVLLTRLSDENVEKILNSVLIIAFLVSILGLIEYIFITGARIQSTFTNPNPFGIFIGMFFLTTLSIGIRIKSKSLDFFSILFLTTLFLSGSRASMGAVSVSIFLIYFGLTKENLKKGIIKTIIVILIALTTTQILMYVSIYTRENIFINKSVLESITRRSSFVTSSLKGRLEFWRVAFELFKNKPITGYGLGTYFSAYYTEYGMNQWYARFTHNHYLQIASELGIVGILVFLSFIWNSFKGIVFSAKNDYKPEYFWGMVSAIVAFLLHIGVDFSWNFPGVTIIFILFLAIVT